MVIFKSCFSLGFKDRKLEKEYKEVERSNLKRFNKIYTHISLGIILLADAFLYSFYNSISENARNAYPVIFYTSIVLSLASIVCSIVETCYDVSYCIHKMICYYNCVCLYFSFSFLRYTAFTNYNQDEGLFYLMILFEFVTRILIIFSGLLGFLETLSISFCLIASFLVFYSPIITWWSRLPYSFILYIVFVILTIFFSYFIAREQRRSFYYNNLNKKNILWYENIFDKSSFGFLQISDNKILFANKLMKTKLIHSSYMGQNSLSNNHTLIKNSSSNVIETSNLDCKYDPIIKELFSNIEASIFLNDYQGEQVDDNECVNCFLSQLKKHFMERKEENFIYLGIKTFQIKNTLLQEENTFEILYRYYYNDNNNFEFIFNDITRTREEEKKNAEFKYKALYLAKVAHEFKNPLLCISEVVEKCQEISNEIKENRNNIELIKEVSLKLEENLFLVNSFSKYLIMLVKDLDYFSRSTQANDKNNPLLITKINLDEMLKFVSDITRGLIIKSNKHSTVKFTIKKDHEIPKNICVDDIKLKQVLINLCSNAVKFTNAGKINLELQKKETKIRFTIEDTGIGISNDRLKDLFRPFQADINSKNLLGTGLGLSIVSDITTKFGSPIQYESAVGVGSKFWFEINTDTMRLYESKSKEVCKDFSAEGNKGLEVFPMDIMESGYSTHTVKHDFIAIKINYEDEEIQRIIYSKTNINEYNIIIADDDTFIRNSVVRIFTKAANQLKINLTIREADDGIGVLYYVYDSIKTGKFIDFIVSDETMDFLSGSKTFEILGRMMDDHKVRPLDFFLVTAYDTMHFKGFKGVYSKPMTLDLAIEILSNYT